MMDVSIMGVKRIVVTKHQSHPNEGVWLSLEDKEGIKVWVTVWIPFKQLGVNLSELAGLLINAKDEDKITYIIEAEKEDATRVEAQTNRV